MFDLHICNDVILQLLTAEIVTDGRFAGDRVLIPRMDVQPPDDKDPTHQFIRRQFPVRLAYAMTVNKSQGQSLKKVCFHCAKFQ